MDQTVDLKARLLTFTLDSLSWIKKWVIRGPPTSNTLCPVGLPHYPLDVWLDGEEAAVLQALFLFAEEIMTRRCGAFS
jgi:hypothetical protein